MNVEDWMSEPVVTVGVGTPLSDCAKKMRARKIRHLPVVDANQRIVSLLTDFEFELRGRFLSGMWMPHNDSDNWLLAGDVGRKPEVVVSPLEPLVSGLEKLEKAYQDCIIVVNPNQEPIGILTEHDVVGQARTLLPADLPVAAIARTDLPLLQADSAATEARSWMARNRLRHALVVDDGVLAGVLSFRDVALEEAVEEVDLLDAASDPEYRTEPLSARAAATVLYDKKYGCLPIVDAERKPIAIVTRRELIDAVLHTIRG